ncbi:MAG: hypothetical protein ABMA64_10445 [Myxococcota bacterium]
MSSTVRFGAAAALAVLAGLEALYGLAAASTSAASTLQGAFVPGAPFARGAVFGALTLGLSWAGAAATAGAAMGIASGTRAGWWLGLLGAAAWIPTGCAPAALVTLAILAAPDVRRVAFPVEEP